MVSEYRFEPYEPRHRQAVRSLLRQLLIGRTDDTLDRYLAWKFEENPWMPQPLMALVFAGPDLVGMRALVGTRWRDAEGVSLTLPAAEDLVIDAHHRDRGLFMTIDRELGRLARDRGYTSLLSSSARNDTTQALQLATGWEHTDTLQAFMHPPTRPPGAIRSSEMVRKIIGRSARLARRAPRIASLVDSHRWPAELELVDEPDPVGMAALAVSPQDFGPLRDAEFYRWRLENPDRHYEYLEWRDTELRGFLVLSRLPPPSRQVRVVDSGAAGVDVLEAMIGAITASPTLSLAMATHRLPAEPARLGFGGRPQDFVKVFVKPLTTQPLPQLSRIDLLDTMLV